MEPYYGELAKKFEARGYARGYAKARARSLIELLRIRGLEVAPDQRECVMRCDDIAQLRTWFARALSANSIAEVFDDVSPATTASAG